ncbi:MAG: hypothetical protein JXQ23_05065 [Clostridia bacterium]|nr:hypothetical protein [Clostridia bacterium]
MNKDMFIKRITEKLNNEVFQVYNQIKILDNSLSKLYPIAVVDHQVFYVFDFDELLQKYVFVLENQLPGISMPEHILASFPLEFYGGKPAAIITEHALSSTSELINVFHEFVHCHQYEFYEMDLRKNLEIAMINKKSDNFMWK